ncbi:MAG: hypothetical protein NTY47_06525, partial [Candidatus Omnitrophica bacterium]|nr:hypothetical protein [Candidatus Omnitrophota bacterium]
MRPLATAVKTSDKQLGAPSFALVFEKNNWKQFAPDDTQHCVINRAWHKFWGSGYQLTEDDEIYHDIVESGITSSIRNGRPIFICSAPDKEFYDELYKIAAEEGVEFPVRQYFRLISHAGTYRDGSGVSRSLNLFIPQNELVILRSLRRTSDCRYNQWLDHELGHLADRSDKPRGSELNEEEITLNYPVDGILDIFAKSRLYQVEEEYYRSRLSPEFLAMFQELIIYINLRDKQGLEMLRPRISNEARAISDRFAAALGGFVDNCIQFMEMIYDVLPEVADLQEFGKIHYQASQALTQAGLDADLFIRVHMEDMLREMRGYIILSEISESKHKKMDLGGQTAQIDVARGMTILSSETALSSGLMVKAGGNRFIIYLEDFIPGSISYMLFETKTQALQNGRLTLMLQEESGYQQYTDIQALLLVQAWRYHYESDIKNEILEAFELHEVRHIADCLSQHPDYNEDSDAAAWLTMIAIGPSPYSVLSTAIINLVAYYHMTNGDTRYAEMLQHAGARNNIFGVMKIFSKIGELLNIPQDPDDPLESSVAVAHGLYKMKDPTMVRIIAFRAFRELFNRPLAEGSLLQEYKAKYAPGIHDLAQETPEGAEPVFAPLKLLAEPALAATAKKCDKQLGAPAMAMVFKDGFWAQYMPDVAEHRVINMACQGFQGTEFMLPQDDEIYRDLAESDILLSVRNGEPIRILSPPEIEFYDQLYRIAAEENVALPARENFRLVSHPGTYRDESGFSRSFNLLIPHNELLILKSLRRTNEYLYRQWLDHEIAHLADRAGKQRGAESQEADISFAYPIDDILGSYSMLNFDQINPELYPTRIPYGLLAV